MTTQLFNGKVGLCLINIGKIVGLVAFKDSVVFAIATYSKDSKYNLKLYGIKFEDLLSKDLRVKEQAFFKRKLRIEEDVKDYEIAIFWDKASESLCLKLLDSSMKAKVTSESVIR